MTTDHTHTPRERGGATMTAPATTRADSIPAPAPPGRSGRFGIHWPGAGDDVDHGSISARAVPFYNTAHRMLIAFAFTATLGIGLAPLAPVPLALFIGSLSWMAHIALDRTAGYGLRNPDGSRDRT